MLQKPNGGQPNNPVAQVAKMYNLIEAHLRKGPIGIMGLMNKPDVADVTKSIYQVRDLVKTLVKKKHVIKTGQGRDAQYVWDPKSPPFVLSTRQVKNAARAPSEPTVTTYSGANDRRRSITNVPSTTKEVEVQIGKTSVVIGRNPVSGRIRIIIEEL